MTPLCVSEFEEAGLVQRRTDRKLWLHFLSDAVDQARIVGVGERQVRNDVSVRPLVGLQSRPHLDDPFGQTSELLHW